MKKIILILSMIFISCISALANDAFVNIAGLGNLVLVQRHLDNGVDVNAKHSEDGKTALIKAAENGHLEVVRILINNGANINTQDINFNTALSFALENGHTKVADLLKEYGAKEHEAKGITIQNIIPLLSAREGQENIIDIKNLLQTGNINAKNDRGWTALIMASYYGYIEIVRALILAGADVNAKATANTTALIFTSLRGHTDVVETLISAGADVNAQSSIGWIALISASSNGHTEIVNLLKAAGAR